MNEEFNSALTYLIAFVLFLTKTFFNEVILVDTNRIIKGPNLEFGGFLGFIGIRWLRTEKCGTNGAEYFSKNTIDILVGDKFVSTILCLEIFSKVSAIISSLLPPPPYPPPFWYKIYESWQMIFAWNGHMQKSSYRIESHVQINLCPYVWIILHTQALFSALASLIKMVMIITSSGAVKVVLCTAGRLLRGGIIQFQWGDLNLRQVLIRRRLDSCYNWIEQHGALVRH